MRDGVLERELIPRCTLWTFNLSKTLKNVELKTLLCSSQVCLNVLKRIVCIKESNISVTLVCPNETLNKALFLQRAQGDVKLLSLHGRMFINNSNQMMFLIWNEQFNKIMGHSTQIQHGFGIDVFKVSSNFYICFLSMREVFPYNFSVIARFSLTLSLLKVLGIVRKFPVCKFF